MKTFVIFLISVLLSIKPIFSQNDRPRSLYSFGYGYDQFYSKNKNYPVSSGVSNCFDFSIYIKLFKAVYLKTGALTHSAYSDIYNNTNIFQIRQQFYTMSLGLEGISKGDIIKCVVGIGTYDSFSFKRSFKSYNAVPPPSTEKNEIVVGGLYFDIGIQFKVYEGFNFRLKYCSMNDLWFHTNSVNFKSEYIHNLISFEIIDVF